MLFLRLSFLRQSGERDMVVSLEIACSKLSLSPKELQWFEKIKEEVTILYDFRGVWGTFGSSPFGDEINFSGFRNGSESVIQEILANFERRFGKSLIKNEKAIGFWYIEYKEDKT